jgi:rare lipoprotein A
MKKIILSLAICIVATPTLFAANANSKLNSRDDKVVSSSSGVASWYGGRWIGRKTANGEIYQAGDMTAAHKTLPFGTRVRVTDLRTGESTVVRINNRGPFIRGRVIDLSVAAASDLGIMNRGLARVKLEVLDRKSQRSRNDAPRSKNSTTRPKNAKDWFLSLFDSDRDEESKE